ARRAVAELLNSGAPPEPPAPPPTPANTYQWPQIPFVPSRTVHILYSGMRPPQEPVINHAGTVFSAYAHTLVTLLCRGWEGNRWHVGIPSGPSADPRFDFLLVLSQEETTTTCLGLLRSAIE